MLVVLYYGGRRNINEAASAAVAAIIKSECLSINLERSLGEAQPGPLHPIDQVANGAPLAAFTSKWGPSARFTA